MWDAHRVRLPADSRQIRLPGNSPRRRSLRAVSCKVCAAATLDPPSIWPEANMRSHWDPHWKLWTWQRFQQLVGAALIAVPTSYFLLCLAKGQLPADFDTDIS